MRAYLCAGFLGLLLWSSPSSAQDFPSMYVYGEDDEADERSCNARHASAVAAVESELRQNQVPTVSRAVALGGRALQIYVQLNALELETGCAVAIRLSLENYQPVILDVTGETLGVVAVISNRSSLLTGSASNMQTRINEALRGYLNEALSEDTNRRQQH